MMENPDPYEEHVTSRMAGYVVLSARDPITLGRMVSDHIRSGWIPQGGVSTSGESTYEIGNFHIYQAMVHPDFTRRPDET